MILLLFLIIFNFSVFIYYPINFAPKTIFNSNIFLNSYGRYNYYLIKFNYQNFFYNSRLTLNFFFNIFIEKKNLVNFIMCDPLAVSKFKKIKSIHRSLHTNTITKLLNFFIYKGFKLKLFTIFSEFIDSNVISNSIHLFKTFNFFYLLKNYNIQDSYLDYQQSQFKSNIINYSLFNNLVYKVINLINNINIIFIFKFNKVDKKIRKYSRGKSGKYKIEFKYLPVFKRLNFIFHTLSQDFRMTLLRGFKNRFLRVLINFFFTKTNSIFRIKNYANKYLYSTYNVFKNY